MTLEDFNQVVNHRKVDRYLRGDFFHQIRLFFDTKLYACCISIGKRPREGQTKLSNHSEIGKHRLTRGSRVSNWRSSLPPRYYSDHSRRVPPCNFRKSNVIGAQVTWFRRMCLSHVNCKRCACRKCAVTKPCNMYSNLRAFVNLISTSLCSRLSSSSSTCALRRCG